MFKKTKVIYASKASMEFKKQVQEKVAPVAKEVSRDTWVYRALLDKAKAEVAEEHFTHQQAEKVVARFADKHNINVQYDSSHVKNQPIAQLNGMQLNSALIVGSQDPKFMHRDAFIKDADNDIICVLSYEISMLWEDKTVYDPATHYNNDIFKLIEDNCTTTEDCNTKLFPQADSISCFALNLKYVKTLLQQQRNLKKSLKFQLLDGNGRITKHFIPCAEVLKYSQSDRYNEAMVGFVCAKKDTFTIVDKNGKHAMILSLLGHLKKTLQNSKHSNNTALAASTNQLIKNLDKFQKEFSNDYKQIVKKYREVDFIENNVKIEKGYGKKTLEQEVCRCLDLVDQEQEDESSSEEDVGKLNCFK